MKDKFLNALEKAKTDSPLFYNEYRLQIDETIDLLMPLINQLKFESCTLAFIEDESISITLKFTDSIVIYIDFNLEKDEEDAYFSNIGMYRNHRQLWSHIGDLSVAVANALQTLDGGRVMAVAFLTELERYEKAKHPLLYAQYRSEIDEVISIIIPLITKLPFTAFTVSIVIDGSISISLFFTESVTLYIEIGLDKGILGNYWSSLRFYRDRQRDIYGTMGYLDEGVNDLLRNLDWILDSLND